MDEQRLSAYLNLVNALLTCPSGQEGEILSANQNLIDAHLVHTMEQLATKILVEKGDKDSAIFLQNLASQVRNILKSSSATDSDKNLTFLLEVLQAIYENGANPQITYPILQANIDNLNSQMTVVIQTWANTTLADEITTDETELLASLLCNFGNLIQEFPFASKADNLEIAIAAYEGSMLVFKIESYPLEWAQSQINLGSAYLGRICGSRAENIEIAIAHFISAFSVFTVDKFPMAWAASKINLGRAYYNRIRGAKIENLEVSIACYKEALQVYYYQHFPEQWASLQNSLANAYSDRIMGDRANNIEIAISCYQSALQVYTLEAFPEQWATTQNNLGAVYNDRILGLRSENLEKARDCYQNALLIRTREALPQKWAATQNNLATFYNNRIQGNRYENLEMAICCYHKALEVYTHQAFPYDWAMIQNNLGNTYSNKINGDRAENIDAAIRCFQRALEVYTRADFPENWAMTQNNLGNAYSNKINGNRAENIDAAIRCYLQALEVYTRADFPEDWATTQNNLGIAYFDKITGNRAENIDEAIRCFQIALEVYTRADFPPNWAGTQNNLGNAYRDKISGNRAENIDAAVRCYLQALEVYTRADFPENWAMTQNNLGLAYLYKISGDRAENIDAAIRCYLQALEVYTRADFPKNWAMTQNNLGLAYSDKISGDRAENIDEAIRCYQLALEVYTRADFPENWAMTQNNLGLAYSNKISGDRAENIDVAICCFQLALEFRTPTTLPLDCLQSGRNLGNLGFKEGLWEIAIEGYTAAINAVEKSRSWSTTDASRQQILADSIDVYENIIQSYINSGKLDKAIEYADRSRSKRLVDLMASNDLYAGGEIPPLVREYLQQHDELQAQIDAERKRLQNDSDSSKQQTELGSLSLVRAAREAATQNIIDLEAQKQQIWEQMRRLDPVLAGEIQVKPLDFATIQQLTGKPQTAILNFFTTDSDTHIFIIYKDKSPQLHTCTGFGYQTLRDLVVDKWLIPYLDRKNNGGIWYAKISEFLQNLAEKLQLKTLVKNHLTGIEELIIIPHLFWHQIPFAALPLTVRGRVNSQPSKNWRSQTIQQVTEIFICLDKKEIIADASVHSASVHSETEIISTQYLGDRFRLRYIPSCQILQYCQQRPQLSQINYGTVEDADGTLLGARFEGEKIAQLYQIPETQRLRGPTQATVQNYRQLAHRVQVLHSSHHASSRLDNPLESSLYLGDGIITLGEIMTPKWRLPNLVDVFLSCCETNLSIAGISDDILSLSTGFLCAGARSVVSTLWAVDDLATALFSISYYQYRSQGNSRLEALQQAQNYLRNLKLEKLKADLESEFQSVNQARFAAQNKLEKTDKTSQLYLELEEEVNSLTTVSDAIHKFKTKRLPEYGDREYPFADPFYWAGFICSGLS